MVSVSYCIISKYSQWEPFRVPLDNDLHVHVSVNFNHPPLLVVHDSPYYHCGETPLVMATRNGQTQVVDFLKSRLPQGEYIVSVCILVYYSLSSHH